jgi:hypothetical protein
MRQIAISRHRLPCLLLFFALFAAPATAQSSARLQINSLERLAPRAVEAVDVNIDERLLQLAGRYLSSNNADEAQVRELVANLNGIYVKSFTFEQDGEYSPTDVDAIRAQLRAPGWTRIIDVRSRRENENIEVYIMTEGERIGGLAVISSAPRELTVINIVGSIDLERLSQLEGNFGIPQLEMERVNAPTRERP